MNRKFSAISLTLSLASNSIIHAEDTYVAPVANKIMFHVDKLPIDKGMRKHLSTNLTILAKRAHDGSAREHRLTAQLLMLAMRLDRENSSAVELNKNLAKGRVQSVSSPQEKLDALRKLKRTVEMLSGTDRLSEGRVLAVYLKDVMIALDQNSPLAGEHKENPKRWDGVVPVFVKKDKVIEKPKPKLPDTPFAEGEMADEPNIGETENGENNGEEKKFTKWTKNDSSISTPLIFTEKVEDDLVYTQEMATIYTRISPRVKLESELSLELKPWAKPEKIDEFLKYINPLMQKNFGNYESLKVEITTEGYIGEKNHRNILFPLFLQLKASEKNIQIRNGLAVLGKLNGKKVERNSDFWHLLKKLRTSENKNHRLLIPYNAEADLKQLVALEEEDFFVRYEVLLVSNLDEALDLSGQSNNATIQEASEEFAKIQAMIGQKSVGPFAVNKKIRARLEGILAKNPNHVSAKMILLRGGVSRSRKLDTYFVADELLPLLSKVSYLQNKKEDEISGESVTILAKKIEANVEELYPFVHANDRELVNFLSDIADLLKKIGRAKEKRESIAVERTITNSLNNFKIKYLEAKTRFDTIMSNSPEL